MKTQRALPVNTLFRRGGSLAPTCGARNRRGGTCQLPPIKGGNGRCIRHGGPALARLYRERQIADVKAGRMSFADWQRAEARRAANRLHDRWKRDPWLPGSTIALTAADEDALRADVLAVGRGLPPAEAMPPAVADWLRWRWRRFRVDQDRPDRWRDVLTGQTLRERLAKAGARPPDADPRLRCPDADAYCAQEAPAGPDAALTPRRVADVPDGADVDVAGGSTSGTRRGGPGACASVPSASAHAALASINGSAAPQQSGTGPGAEVAPRVWHGCAPVAGSGRAVPDAPRQPPLVRGKGYARPGRPRSGPPNDAETLALHGVLARMRPTLGPMLARLDEDGAGEEARWRLLRAAQALEEAPGADRRSGRATVYWTRTLAALGLR